QTPGQASNKEQEEQRAYVQFLMNCLGNCWLPVGVPLLKEIALKEDGADPQMIKLRREVAVWALAKLGDNLKNLDALSADRREIVLAELEQEAAGVPSERREWATLALDYLRDRSEKGPQALGVEQVLARCASSGDPLLRKYVALALSFWE